MMKPFSLIACLILTGLSIQPAQAHTSIVKVVPEYKTTMDVMVDEISIEFTDELMTLGSKKVNSLDLVGPDGKKIPLENLSVEKNFLRASVPAADYLDGTYIVSYRVVSADGHGVSGSYELYLHQASIGVPAPTRPAGDEDEEHEGAEEFFHFHQSHFIWSGAIAICLLLWIIYRRFTKEQDE